VPLRGIITSMDVRLTKNPNPQSLSNRSGYRSANGALTPYMPRQSQSRAKDPFCCAYCGSRAYLKAFATVYGNGSMMARSKRGLILKTGWSQTFRQSIVAEKCSPPKQRLVFWRVSVMLLGVGTLAASTMYQLRSEISEVASVVFLFGIFMVFDAIRWNKVKFPLRMARWENSYLCSRCSKVTIIEPVAEQ
jgi:DNA-directed RNA polymerase subunit RPC12/RpoP